MHMSLQLDLGSVNNFLFALGGVPYFYDLGLKKSDPCPESQVGPL